MYICVCLFRGLHGIQRPHRRCRFENTEKTQENQGRSRNCMAGPNTKRKREKTKETVDENRIHNNK